MDPERRAREALSAYGLESAPLDLLRTLGNVVARVEGASAAFALRVCAPTVTHERLSEELAYLDSLARETEVMVPRPVPDTRGHLVSGSTGHHAVLFEWIEGEPVSQQMDTETARALGQLSARLHQHGRGYAPPQPWVGPRYDAAWLNGPASWWRTQAAEHLGAATVSRLSPAVARCARLLAVREPLQQPIHSDLHFGNVLRTAQGWAVIDFDSCALGDPAFDLALTEGEFLDFEDGPQLISAFRAAYQERTGEAYPASEVELLRVATSLAFLEWVYGSPNPQVREQKLRWVPHILVDIEARLV